MHSDVLFSCKLNVPMDMNKPYYLKLAVTKMGSNIDLLLLRASSLYTQGRSSHLPIPTLRFTCSVIIATRRNRRLVC